MSSSSEFATTDVEQEERPPAPYREGEVVAPPAPWHEGAAPLADREAVVPDRGKAPRVLGVDLARGIALLGMIAAHVMVTTIPFELSWNPATWGSLVNGRSSILFATLAGVSLALMSGGATGDTGSRLRDDRTRILVRAALIFPLGGLLQIVAGGIGVILEIYAVLMVVCVPLLRMRSRTLLLIAVGNAMVAPLVTAVLTEQTGSSFFGFTALGALTAQGPYPVLIWLTFFLVGLAVGRMDLSVRRVQGGLAIAGIVLMLVGYGGGYAATHVFGSSQIGHARVLESGQSSAPSDQPTVAPQPGESSKVFEPGNMPEPGGGNAPSALSAETLRRIYVGADPHSGTPFEVIGSGGYALTVLGLCLLVSGRLRRILAPIATAGSMTLTLYTAHILILAIPIGFWAGHEVITFTAMVVGMLVFAVAWRHWLGKGPMERAIAAVARRTTAIRPGEV